MTDEWMWMRKPGIDEPAQVTRDAFTKWHEPQGWVEYEPPAPAAVDGPPVEGNPTPDEAGDQDSQPPAEESQESDADSTTTPRKRTSKEK
jgi:hypothetical protein